MGRKLFRFVGGPADGCLIETNGCPQWRVAPRLSVGSIAKFQNDHPIAIRYAIYNLVGDEYHFDEKSEHP